MADTVDLLFFDTFAHENSEELNLDLVQFPKPVFVTEVRIIPLGARVHADFPGGVRLGATNPTQFSIEFFVNDLSKSGASSFETLGGFEYNQNGCINLECIPDESIRKIPTDGLVLRGLYTTITLAVYGILTSNLPEQNVQATPSIPPQANLLSEVPTSIPVSTIKIESSEWNQENAQPIAVEFVQQPTPAYAQAYSTPEQFVKQEYPDFYTEVPKDPRSFHNTPETDWDTKSSAKPVEHDNRDSDRYPNAEHTERENTRSERDRSRHYSRSHSQERDWQSRSRNYRDSNDWEHEYKEHSNTEWEHIDRERSYKHQDSHRRGHGRDDNREDRHQKSSKPRTPPSSSPKRPHTPHVDKKEPPPPVKLENQSDEDMTNIKHEKEKDALNAKNIEKVCPIKETLGKSSSPNEELIRMDVEEFEPILSDEDIVDDSEHFQDLDFDYTAYTNNDDLIKLFIPGTTTLRKYIKAPVFNVTCASLGVTDELKATIYITDEFFRSSITKYTFKDFEKLNAELKEEFIHLCEKIMSTLGEEENFCHIIQLYCLVKKFDQSKLSNADKEIIKHVKGITETLIEWVKIALNFEMANMQSQPPYKIRHIKCGIRLAKWCCSSEDFLKLLWDDNYCMHNVLLNLYNQEYMALSIKLMILHALDAYLLFKSSIEYFVSGKVHNVKQNGFTDSSYGQNGYKALIEIINKNPSVRLKFALQSILMKLNLFEVLSNLHNTVSKVNHSTGCNIDDLDEITKSIEQILFVYRSGSFSVSQPRRFLPVSAQFEINRSETKNIFVKFFKMLHLMDCFTLLLSFSSDKNSWNLKVSILDILSELLLSNEGLHYLCDNCDSLNVLLKILLQNEESSHYMMPYSTKVLGLRIAYFVQCQYHVDYLLDLGELNKFDCDMPDVIDQLHGLFCLTFSNIGKLACAAVLGYNNNMMKSLLQFLDVLYLKERSETQLEKLKKLPAVGYIIDLVACTIIYNTDITVIENCIKQLLNIINQQELFEEAVIAKINEFAVFVKPLENLLPLNYSNITPIMETVVKHVETVTTAPGHLITPLRVLQYLGITKHSVSTESPLNNYCELKFKYVIIQLFANDGIALLTRILQKICEFYEQPTLHTATFVSHQGVLLINVIEPCINLLYQLLSYVIQCSNTNFKDTTTIPVLLQMYNLLRSFYITSPMYFIAKNLCVKLIDTLLVYTQPISDEVNEKDSLNKTLWALMCNEVIKYINWAPCTFISGLLIFSELLPLPLPIQTRYTLLPEEISFAINLRKLWAAHLHAFSSNIQEFINRLCTSNNPSLLSLLRKVCIQLADLAANSAVMIARGILDTIYNALISEDDDANLPPCTTSTARLLNLLACLVTHNSLKCAVLHFLQVNNPNIAKGDEKYSNLLQVFAKLLNTNVSSPVHVQAQECILSIIQCLCDSEITLLQNSDVTPDIYLANSIPAKDTLVFFIGIIMDHLIADNSFVTYLPIVRTLVLINEHDYGFYHLKDHLNKRNEPFLPVLNKLVNNFSNDNVECLSTLNTLMELLRMFILRIFMPIETSEAAATNARTMKMLPCEIKLLLGWKDLDSSKEDKHPLYMLEELLKRHIEDDKTLENYLLEGVSNVISMLSGTLVEARDNYIEPVIPPPIPLLAQFAGRSVYTLADILEEQITSMYWLSIPRDEINCEVENVTCDLNDMCRQNLPQDVNLVREIEKVCQIYPSSNVEQEDSKSKGVDIQKEKTKKTFVTPAARRGFPRAVQSRSDVFRSRPPNTSRPPSLHVDDFVALETCGAQPTGPTGYNKISRELLSSNRVTRGSRGRSFVNYERTAQCRQMSWWNAGFGKGPY